LASDDFVAEIGGGEGPDLPNFPQDFHRRWHDHNQRLHHL